jgi:LPXTG-motif cell wall-anchored protein
MKASMDSSSASQFVTHVIAIVIIICLVIPFYPSLVLASTSTDSEIPTTTWMAMNQNYTDAVFTDVAFLNETHGWVVGYWTGSGMGNGIILHTSDAGETWQTQLKNGSEQMYQKIDIVREESVWVTGFRALYHSTDGGLSWEEHKIVDIRTLMSFVEFYDEDVGWTATNSNLFKTIDGGRNWSVVSGWTFGDTPRFLHISSSTEMWSIGFFGIYHSTDGAETWIRVYDYGGWALSIQDNDEGWAVSDGNLMHSSDSIEWSQLSLPGHTPLNTYTLPYFSDIFFIENNGWIVARETPIMHTPDGGNTWYAQSTSIQIDGRMKALDFLNSTYGWAVGYDGVILKTTTGTDLGTRLWTGMTDPLFLTILGGLISVVVVISGGLFYRRRKRSAVQTTMIQ